MEGYFNLSGSNNLFDDFDIEGKKSYDDVGKKLNNSTPKLVSNPPNPQSQEDVDKNRLLNIKVDLDNGAVGYVFSVTGSGYNAQWKCHVCDMIFMGVKNLLFHERSMNHSSLMQSSKHNSSQFLKMEMKDGEPAPPGVDEDDEESALPVLTNIQSTLDDFKSSPLIGLEYVVELNDDYEKEPAYVCMLCDKKGDPRTVMAHLVSYNHRLKYLERHFPVTFNAINSLPKTAGARKGLAEIVLRISSEMEEKLGRLHPTATDGRHFEENRFNLMCAINKGKHFIETPDKTFVHLVDRELLTAPVLKLDEIPVPEASSKTGDTKKQDNEDDDEIEFQGAFVKGTRVPLTRQLRIRKVSVEGEDKSVDGVNKSQNKPAATATKKEDDLCSLSSISSASSSPRTTRSKRTRSRSRSRSGSRARRRRRTRSRSRGRYRRSKSRSKSRGRRSRSPYGRYRQRSPRPGASKRDREDDKKRPKDRVDDLFQEKVKWEKFREDVAVVEKEMLESLSQHEKNPEKHPKYPEEWKLFWNRRYKELQLCGKDPGKHDFKPEWIEFWNRRMRELHEQELMKRKEEIREKLGLPVDEPKPHFNRRKKFVRDVDGHPVEGPAAAALGGKARSRSPSPWEEGVAPGAAGAFPPRERERERERQERERDREREREREWERDIQRDKFERERERDRDFPYRQGRPDWRDRDQRDRSPPRTISVLRMLTALEQQLGSLGPRVNAVLSDAIARDKTGNSDALLADNDVVVLFETVREKFKGQLLAGIVERNHVSATRNAIGAISELLYRAPSLLERVPKSQSPVKPAPEPVVLRIPAPAVPSVAPRLPAPRLAAPPPAPAPAPDPVSVPGVGAVDKAAIALEIAAALIAQGKTDVSEQELEQLVEAVVGMAQARADAQQQPPPTPAAPAAPAAPQFVSTMQPVAQPAAQTAVPPAPSDEAKPAAAPPAQQTPEVTGLQLLQSAYNAEESKGGAAQTSMEQKATDSNAEAIIARPPLLNKMPSNSVSASQAAAAAQAAKIDAFVDELTETDLRLLLQSFKDLPLDEQHGLIRYLKKLEATDPVRVERLRKYVNLGPPKTVKPPNNTMIPLEKLQALAKVGQSGRLSPFSSRQQSRNPSQADAQQKLPALDLDSDSDDDYTFDDVCKVAKQRVSEQEAVEAEKREKEEEKKRIEQEEVNKRLQEEKAKAELALREIEDREREQNRVVKEKERLEREAALKVGAANWTPAVQNNTSMGSLPPSAVPPPSIPNNIPPPTMPDMYGSGYGEMAGSMGNYNGSAGYYGSNSYNQYPPREGGYDQQGGYYQGQQNTGGMYQQQPGPYNSQSYPGYGNNAMYQQPAPPQHPQGQHQGYPVAPYNGQYHY